MGKKRQKVVDKFVEDPKCRVFIGQIQAAGEGIDGLQHVASMGVFVEIAHTPGIIKQAIGRLYREGQKRPCLFQFLLVEGTVDEQVLSNTLFKDKNIKVIMKDEKLGLDFSAPTKKEEEMSIEKNIERIADALEKLVSLREKDVEITLSAATYTEQPSAEPAKPVTATPTPAKQVAQAKAKPAPKPKAGAKGNDNEEYQKEMKEAANKISAFSGDPAKTNALFAKLQKQFKEQFPNNAHVFDVEPKDYATVRKLVGDFMAAEGVV